MDKLIRCQECGYKLRKNSKRILIEIHVNISTIDNTIILQTKDVVLCSVCLNSIKYSVNEYFANLLENE